MSILFYNTSITKKNEEELETLKTKYNDNKSFEGDLKRNTKFIQGIINAKIKEFTNKYDEDFNI